MRAVPAIEAAACADYVKAYWANVRRKFYDLFAAASPIAEEALKRIGALCAIEEEML